MNNWPNEKIKEVSTGVRRIGLGVMGWADMLIELKIRYDSMEALTLADELAHFIENEADAASRFLSLTRGVFPDHDKSIYAEINPIRNSTRTTIAPTGTISIIAGVSSGIEPVYAFEFTRSHYLDKNDPSKRVELTEYHPAYKEFAKSEEKPDYLVSAHDIEYTWHVMMQAAWQAHVDNAVSKTINFKESATLEDVAGAYLLAYNTGCKGITIYRDGSRAEQVLSTPSTKQEAPVKTEVISSRKKLNDTRGSVNHKFSVGSFEGYLSVGMYEDGTPGELFIVGNKSGSTSRGYLDTIGILFSLGLQYGIPLSKLTENLRGTRYEPSGLTKNSEIPIATSIIDYISRWMEKKFKIESATTEIQHSYINTSDENSSGNLCPDCDGIMYYGEGCETCASCGYSKCG